MANWARQGDADEFVLCEAEATDARLGVQNPLRQHVVTDEPVRKDNRRLLGAQPRVVQDKVGVTCQCWARRLHLVHDLEPKVEAETKDVGGVLELEFLGVVEDRRSVRKLHVKEIGLH